MTDDEIKAARAIEQAATPGPWTTVAPRGCPAAFVRASGEQIADAFDGTNWTDEQCQRNADFIAASRTLVPRLLDHVQWLEGEVKRHDFARRQVIAERDEMRAEVEKLKALGLCGANAAGVICGCNRRFDSRDEIFRCVDCGVEFHKHCAREHFAKSGNNFLLAKEDAQLEAKELRLDVSDLRAEVERMRPVYEAAKAERLAELEWDSASDSLADIAECARLSGIWDQLNDATATAIDAALASEAKEPTP